jgi:hypothetical protein
MADIRQAGDNLMADESDVETALVSLAAAALYPQGAGAASVPGPDCRIFRGWPNSAALNSDLSTGLINVTVFPAHGHPRTTTRYAPIWNVVPVQPTLSVAVSGNAVTFGGAADPGQLAGLLINGTTYAYRTQTGDGPASVAANLAVLARADTIVHLANATLMLPNIGQVQARVVADASAQQEVRRQVQSFRVTCWCPTPVTRDLTASTIDASLAGLRFITLPDGSMGHLTYAGTAVLDQSENALLYRRDLIYRIEYPTLLTALQPSMLFGDLLLNAANFAA